jgi:hypothetical protein
LTCIFYLLTLAVIGMVQTGDETDDDGNLFAQIVAAQEAEKPKRADPFFGILYPPPAARRIAK